MQRQVFYSEKVKFWDIVILIMYVILSFELWFFTKEATGATQNEAVYWYAVATQLLLYHFLYKALRNLKIYFLWVAMGLGHLGLYFVLKERATWIGFHNNNLPVLCNTIVLLLLFQVLRSISLRTQKLELICPGRNKSDLFDHRAATRLDHIFYVVYMGVTFLLLGLQSN